jgi:hypothetical protein
MLSARQVVAGMVFAVGLLLASVSHGTAADENAVKAPAPPGADAILLHGVPAAKGDGNEFARGLEVLLTFAGDSVDYDTLMGDLGFAFTLQASDQVPRYNGALDVGWWPLDPACVPTYFDFVGRTVGRRLEYMQLGVVPEADLPKVYREKAQPRVEAALRAGSSLLAIDCCWKAVTGCDQGEPPLLGVAGWVKGEKQIRFPSYPWAFTFLGDAVPKLDRADADREALQHAVALGRDEVTMPGGFVTGQKAYVLWEQTLRDTEHMGEARWHWNTVGHLTQNRTSAVAYLRAMAARQPAAAPHLLAAVAAYEQTLAQLKAADLSDEALMSKEGREKVAVMAEGVARSEADAAKELEQAMGAIAAPRREEPK